MSIKLLNNNPPKKLECGEVRVGGDLRVPSPLHMIVFPLQDDDYNVIYRPAPNDNGSTYYYVHDNVLDSLAYNAKVQEE